MQCMTCMQYETVPAEQLDRPADTCSCQRGLAIFGPRSSLWYQIIFSSFFLSMIIFFSLPLSLFSSSSSLLSSFLFLPTAVLQQKQLDIRIPSWLAVQQSSQRCGILATRLLTKPQLKWEDICFSLISNTIDRICSEVEQSCKVSPNRIQAANGTVSAVSSLPPLAINVWELASDKISEFA